jgi:hypothetical protein
VRAFRFSGALRFDPAIPVAVLDVPALMIFVGTDFHDRQLATVRRATNSRIRKTRSLGFPFQWLEVGIAKGSVVART